MVAIQWIQRLFGTRFSGEEWGWIGFVLCFLSANKLLKDRHTRARDGERCGHDDSGYPVTAEKSSPQTSTQKQESLSPEELLWIAGLEQALPKDMWDSLPDVPLTTFTQVPPEEWPKELREKLEPYMDLSQE